MPFASQVWPVPNRFVNIGKESPAGSVAAGTYTFPLTQFKPVDKYTYLEDAAWRNAMAELYNLIQGVRIADISIGGPLFIDGIGYPLADILGDYWQFVNGVPGSSSSLSVSSAIGATQIVVANAGGFGVGTIVSIGATNTTAEEVRKITAVTGTSPGTLTLNSALYQAHATPGTVFAFPAVTNIGHNFSLLNGQPSAPAGYVGAGGYVAAQPPTYTYEDFTGIPLTSGARNYAFSCYSDVTITGNATALVEWDGKITALASAIAGTQPSTVLTAVAPQPSWVSTVTLAGAGTLNNAEWKLMLARKLSPKFTNQGTQDPFTIARGGLSATLGLNFDPATDESEFNYYLANTQPTAIITASNNLAGTLAASLTVKAQIAAFDTAEINDTKDVFGFDSTVKCVANQTNIGPSGGFSPILITLQNGVISY